MKKDEIQNEEIVAQEEIQEATPEIDWKDQALRALAEMENIKHRSQIEAEKSSKLLLKSFARDIISVLDSYDYAFKACEKLEQTQELKEVISGFQTIYENFIKVLKKHGIEQIDALNKPFDPTIHNAVSFAKGKPNTVIAVLENGYKMGDETLREATVVLGQE